MKKDDIASLHIQIQLVSRERDQWKDLAKKAIATTAIAALIIAFFATLSIIDLFYGNV